MSRPVLLACSLVAASVSLPSFAQSSPPAESVQPDEATKARALDLYEQGARAFDQRRFHDAIDLFLAGDRLLPNSAFAYNIALSYHEVGDTARALRWAREFLRRDPGSGQAAEIASMVRRLEARLAERGLQQLTVSSDPPGATVAIDGRPLGVTPWTGELVPGAHQLEVRLRGHDDAQQSFELPADRAIDLEVTLSESAAASESAPKTELPPPRVGHSAPREISVSPWTIAALATGVAGVGVAVGLEVARGRAESSAREAPTQIETLDEFRRMENFQLGARVAVGAGGAIFVAGVALLIVDLVADGEEASVSAGFQCDPWLCAAAVRGRF
jgi:tetratricopeptide (TPR) repeat protein